MTGRNRARIYHITEWALIQRDERAGVPETSLARAGCNVSTRWDWLGAWEARPRADAVWLPAPSWVPGLGSARAGGSAPTSAAGIF
jgi:hypothetical protein